MDWEGTSGVFPSNVLALYITPSDPPAAVAAADAEPNTPDHSNELASCPPAVYVALNPYSETVSLALPIPPHGTQWRRLLDSSLLVPEVRRCQCQECVGPLDWCGARSARGLGRAGV